MLGLSGVVGVAVNGAYKMADASQTETAAAPGGEPGAGRAAGAAPVASTTATTTTTTTATATTTATTTTAAKPAAAVGAGAGGNICASTGCGKPGTMQCPTCQQLNIPGSRFCSQDCFKTSWNEHKALHKLFRDAVTSALAAAASDAPLTTAKVRIPKSFDGFRFSGKIRPYETTAQMRVPPGIPKPDYADHPNGVSAAEEKDRGNRKVVVNSPANIEKIRKACRIAREVLDEASKMLAPGVTGEEIDKKVFEATIARGAYPSPLNYYKFPKSLCISANEVICHGIPDLRPFEDGDIVNLDISCYIDGVHSDLNETFLVGKVDEDSVRVVRTAYQCLQAAVEMCRPGVMYREVGDAISKVARTNGCSVVTAYCGHGVGTLFHSAPSIPHYGRNKAVGVMAPGHIFTIEPMINLGTSNDMTWPDGWTSTTTDGKRSAQFEHTLLVTETGVEILTAAPGETAMAWNEERFRRPVSAPTA